MVMSTVLFVKRVLELVLAIVGRLSGVGVARVDVDEDSVEGVAGGRLERRCGLLLNCGEMVASLLGVSDRLLIYHQLHLMTDRLYQVKDKAA